ncbi:MAG: MerR family transcriptional regulator [Pseudoclavibacter sp.]
MVELMSIGEFAATTWLSPKALRLYDEKGLLSPDVIDPGSGYRKYDPAQIETARLITLLRRIEMPLEQIRELLAAPEAERAARIARFREREAEQHARRQSLARFIEHAVESGSFQGDAQPGVSTFDIADRAVPDAPMLTAVRHTAAKDLPDVIREHATRLQALADDRGGGSGQLIVIYHGQVGWESDGPIEVCVPVSDRDRTHRIEAGHRELSTEVAAADVQFPRILAAFEAVQSHASRLGLAPAGPPREIYEPGSGGATLRCEVALPVVERSSS